MEFKEPLHGYCDPEIYSVVVPVALSFGEIVVDVCFDRKTGAVKETEALRECCNEKMHHFDAPATLLRKAEVIARQFAGNALPPQVSGLVN